MRVKHMNMVEDEGTLSLDKLKRRVSVGVMCDGLNGCQLIVE